MANTDDEMEQDAAGATGGQAVTGGQSSTAPDATAAPEVEAQGSSPAQPSANDATESYSRGGVMEALRDRAAILAQADNPPPAQGRARFVNDQVEAQAEAQERQDQQAQMAEQRAQAGRLVAGKDKYLASQGVQFETQEDGSRQPAFHPDENGNPNFDAPKFAPKLVSQATWDPNAGTADSGGAWVKQTRDDRGNIVGLPLLDQGIQGKDYQRDPGTGEYYVPMPGGQRQWLGARDNDYIEGQHQQALKQLAVASQNVDTARQGELKGLIAQKQGEMEEAGAIVQPDDVLKNNIGQAMAAAESSKSGIGSWLPGGQTREMQAEQSVTAAKDALAKNDRMRQSQSELAALQQEHADITQRIEGRRVFLAGMALDSAKQKYAVAAAMSGAAPSDDATAAAQGGFRQGFGPGGTASGAVVYPPEAIDRGAAGNSSGETPSGAGGTPALPGKGTVRQEFLLDRASAIAQRNGTSVADGYQIASQEAQAQGLGVPLDPTAQQRLYKKGADGTIKVLGLSDPVMAISQAAVNGDMDTGKAVQMIRQAVKASGALRQAQGGAPNAPDNDVGPVQDFVSRIGANMSSGLNGALEGLSRLVGANDAANYFKGAVDATEDFRRLSTNPTRDKTVLGYTGNVLGSLGAMAPAMLVGAVAAPAAATVAGGTALATIAPMLAGAIPMGLQGAGEAGAAAWNAAKAQGKSDAEAGTASNAAMVKSLPGLLLYMGAGSVAGKLIGGATKLMPALETPWMRGLATAAVNAPLNVAASTAGRMIEGGKANDFTPEGLAMDLAFAAHGGIDAHEAAKYIPTARAMADGSHPELLLNKSIAHDPSAAPDVREKAADAVTQMQSGAKKFLGQMGANPAARQIDAVNTMSNLDLQPDSAAKRDGMAGANAQANTALNQMVLAKPDVTDSVMRTLVDPRNLAFAKSAYQPEGVNDPRSAVLVRIGRIAMDTGAVSQAQVENARQVISQAGIPEANRDAVLQHSIGASVAGDTMQSILVGKATQRAQPGSSSAVKVNAGYLAALGKAGVAHIEPDGRSKVNLPYAFLLPKDLRERSVRDWRAYVNVPADSDASMSELAAGIRAGQTSATGREAMPAGKLPPVDDGESPTPEDVAGGEKIKATLAAIPRVYSDAAKSSDEDGIPGIDGNADSASPDPARTEGEVPTAKLTASETGGNGAGPEQASGEEVPASQTQAQPSEDRSGRKAETTREASPEGESPEAPTQEGNEVNPHANAPEVGNPESYKAFVQAGKGLPADHPLNQESRLAWAQKALGLKSADEMTDKELTDAARVGATLPEHSSTTQHLQEISDERTRRSSENSRAVADVEKQWLEPEGAAGEKGAPVEAGASKNVPVIPSESLQSALREKEAASRQGSPKLKLGNENPLGNENLSAEEMPSTDRIFSKEPGAKAPKVLGKQYVEAVRDEVVKRMPNAPAVDVVQGYGDLPESVRAKYEKDGVKGFFDRDTGRVTLIADAIKDGPEAVKTVIHELTHGGLDKVLTDPAYQRTMDLVTLESGGKVLDIAQRKGLDINDPPKRREAAEEYLAETAGNLGHLDRVAGFIKDTIQKMFPGVKFSDDEARSILKRSAEFLKGKVGEAKPFSKATGSKPTDAVYAPDGTLNWGEITPKMEKESKGGAVKAGPIRLLNGEHIGPNKGYGAAHLMVEHAADFKRYGFEPEKWLRRALNGFTEILDQGGGRFALVTRGKPRSVGIVELREEKGGFYSVVSAFPKDSPTAKIAGESVWSGRKAATQPSASQSSRTAQGQTGEPVPKPPLEPLEDQTDRSNSNQIGLRGQTVFSKADKDKNQRELDYGQQVKAEARQKENLGRNGVAPETGARSQVQLGNEGPSDSDGAWTKAVAGISGVMDRVKASLLGRAASELVDDARKVAAPQTRGDTALETAHVLQSQNGEMHRAKMVLQASLDGVHAAVESMPKDEQREFMLKLDEGGWTGDRKKDQVMALLRKVDAQKMEQDKAAFAELGIDHWKDYQNYEKFTVPHLFENAEQASRVLDKMIQGGTGFFKHRSDMTMREIIDWALEHDGTILVPKSDNVIDMMFGRWAQHDKYIMAQRVFKMLEGTRGYHWEGSDYVATEDEARVDQKIGYKTKSERTPLGSVTDGSQKEYADMIRARLMKAREQLDKPGTNKDFLEQRIQDLTNTLAQPAKNSRWQFFYGPKEGVDVIQNYLSTGLQGKAWYKAYMAAGNMLNQFQLLGLFHLGFVSADSMTSKVALGLNQLGKGQIGDALKSLNPASVLAAPVTSARRGNEMLRAYMTGEGSPDILKAMNLAVAGGAKFGNEEVYRTQMSKAMRRGFREGSVGGFVKGTLSAPFALAEKFAAPLMEHLVPRMKLGVIYDLAQMELKKNPNMTPEEFRATGSKIVASVDNRMGQMTYDNLHWNKVFKDLMMAITRSVGWNLGTLRELGGGVVDFGKAGLGLVTGNRTDMTYRMAYCMALPMLAGTLGAVINYAATGQWPEELKDYFYPKSGGVNPDGTQARVALPTYMKDVFAYASHPLATIGHKLHPLPAAVLSMMENKDYYGVKIAQEDDKWYQQAASELKFLGKQAVPFSATGTAKMIQAGASPLAVAGSVVGVAPAPGSITQSAAMVKAGGYLSDKLGKDSGRTQAQADRSTAHTAAVQSLRRGDSSVAAAAIQAGTLHPSDMRRMQAEAQLTPLQARVAHLDLNEMQRVFEVATGKEKTELAPVIAHKQQTAAKTEQRQQKMTALPAGYQPFAGRRG